MIMPDTLTLEQVEQLRQTLPQKSFNEMMPTIDADKIVETQLQTIDGVEIFISKEK